MTFSNLRIIHMEKKQVIHLGPLDGLRALATVAIFLYHAGILLQGTFPVTWFFMLSGFVMYYTKHDLTKYPNYWMWLNYVKGKLTEFYPIHFLTFLYSLFLTGAVLNATKIKSAILNLLLLHSFFESCWLDFNSLSWYLSATMFLYVLGYFLILFVNKFKQHRKIIITSVVMVIFAINVLLRMGSTIYVYANPFLYSIGFFPWYAYC